MLLAFGAYIASIQVAISLIVVATAVFLAGLSPLEIVRGTWLFIIACTAFFVVQSVTLPGETVAFRVLSTPIYVESADYALASALRIYTIVLSSIVFVRTTDPRDLAISLVTQMRVPYRVAYAFFIALRIVPMIEDEIQVIRAAQAVRGVARKRGIAGRIGETKR
jgi:energy-coupling factor transport system permease protein